ncbi:hypothetical protein M409DRAFT_58460 [Zasmidium cellare ATCC 36951]|uniref:Heterokaryon incompatibility domain-containing protein n=1 Tax=Zasmidium cellare ATCC 36951 TaxID=1080233 RepID=A0A6A6CA92_ZASCE|nr:uncharacterized protein M409DRAFT_58460 [Zasmidium cellare ATCC 36951]KAF2162366.1 hypothetical protein M409DRAFT_58460 [Zasmidium cellare ATCC 36951]
MLAEGHIRLFELLPPNQTTNRVAPIRGRTHAYRLLGTPQYEAASYVWGERDVQATIEVDGEEVLVTRNLEAVLKRIRLPDRHRLLWVDQISINQSDDIEKVQQVPLMGRIYAAAVQVLAWLGELREGIAVEDAQAAIDILEFFDAHRRDSSTQAPECLRDKQATERAMNAMRTIGVTENEWWRRIWTLQEAVLPARATILWGPCQIAWSTVLNGSNHQIPYELGKFIYRSPSNFQSFNNLITQIRGVEIEKRNGSGPLMAAYRWSFRIATDPLNKVYAFIGLFPPGTFRRAECCDYTLPAATVYAMFTADLIEHHKSFHPITIFGLNRFHPKRAVDLPSWAIDMGIDGYELSIPSVCRDGDSWAWLSMNNYNLYNASGNLDIDWEHFEFNPLDGSLSVSATHVAEICTVGAALSSEIMSDQDTIARIKEWYSTANDFYHAQDWLDPALRRGLWQWPGSFWRGLVGNLARVIYDFEPTRQATESDLLQVYEFVRTGERSL